MPQDEIMEGAGWKLADNDVPGVYVRQQEVEIKNWVTWSDESNNLKNAVLLAMKSVATQHDECH